MFGRRAAIAPRPVAAMPTDRPGPLTPTVAGWKAYGHGQSPVQQIGAYDGTPLNQWPANIPGVQLHCAVENLRSSWYTPVVSVTPDGSIPANPQTYAGTRTPSNVPGYQRNGSRYTGPLGPISVGLMKRRVTAESVRGTAAAAQHWADGLSAIPWGASSE